MAYPGATFLNLLQSVFNEFNRLDLATTAPVLTAPLPTDPVWKYVQEAIEYWQPKALANSQARNQWTSTIVANNPGTGWTGNLYALPPDWEDDVQILINIAGQNQPMRKISEIVMNFYDMQGPPTMAPVIGPPRFYNVWAGQLRVFPWPDAIYPMTAIYQQLIPVPAPTGLSQSNFWTVEAEAMIRHTAAALIKLHYTKEQGAGDDQVSAEREYNKLQGRVRQQSGVGRARPNYL